MYGDDSEEFTGRHEYQTSADPYDAPVRVSKSTERRSGSLRFVGVWATAVGWLNASAVEGIIVYPTQDITSWSATV